MEQPSFIGKNNELLLSMFRSGVHVLEHHLRNDTASIARTVFTLFGDLHDEEQDQEMSDLVRTTMFPTFAALEESSKGFQEGPDNMNKEVIDALRVDVTALFVRVRAIADAGITAHEEFHKQEVPTARVFKKAKLELDAVTTRCTDFHRRFETAREGTARLSGVCNDILLFTQMAARFGLEVPA